MSAEDQTLTRLSNLVIDLEPNQRVSSVEDVLVSKIDEDLGCYEELDWSIKKDIYDSLNVGEISFPVPSFNDLIRHKKQLPLFSKNFQFRLVDSHQFRKLPGKPFEYISEANPNVLQLNQLSFESSQPLSEQVMKVFDGYFSNIRLPYVPVLAFQSPYARNIEESGTPQYGVQSSVYRLCAVVRTTTGHSEHVRLYHQNGSEIPTAPSGKSEKKAVISGNLDWSVRDQGRYVLFYQREYLPNKEWPRSDMDVHLP
ncbi:hypothetical protein DSL72_008893 [Monilinia vaccinii-corymbosi]|uniref:Uncharacterized protein n=1 Tax=Monilinia vaccinii-corymbosi TaxID=61207 RepID=A0A8A3PSF0_9HELO|nr:hypothetical protein DSL72_008893 [Monilinia vaccinii-corymbosi]